MNHAYTEDQLVEQPAIGLFATLGWQTVSAMEETFGAGGTLGRETKGEVVLVERLRKSLTKLNAKLPVETIDAAIDELARDRSAMSLVAEHAYWAALLMAPLAAASETVLAPALASATGETSNSSWSLTEMV